MPRLSRCVRLVFQLFYGHSRTRVLFKSARTICAGISRLTDIGMQPAHPGMGALDMNAAEDAVVGGTSEVVPGCIFCGMEVRSTLQRAPPAWLGRAHVCMPGWIPSANNDSAEGRRSVASGPARMCLACKPGDVQSLDAFTAGSRRRH